MQLKHFFCDMAKAALTVTALCFTGFTVADDYDYQSSQQNPQYQPTQQYQPNCGPACHPSYCVNCNTQSCCEPPVCGWAYNPPGYCNCFDPTCCNSTNKYALILDFLWWKASVAGVALGTEEQLGKLPTSSGSVKPSMNNSSNLFNESHVKRPDFKFEPGFRLALADHSICDCWDASLAWTHFHSTAHAHGASNLSNNGPVTVFLSYWERLPATLVPTESKSRYSLNLDLLDLEFGRKYFVSSCFLVRPFFGLRGARINQDYKVFSESLSFSNNSTNRAAFTSTQNNFGPNFTSVAKSRNNFLAIGPRVGLDAEVKLGCGLSIVGQAAGSMVYGRFDRHSKEDLNIAASNTSSSSNQPAFEDEFFEEEFIEDALITSSGNTEFFYNSKPPKDCSTRAFTDFSIGLKWERCMEWCNVWHPIGVEFTWEHHGFFNVGNFDFDASSQIINGVLSPGIPKKSGDIFTQGLTVSLSLGF